MKTDVKKTCYFKHSTYIYELEIATNEMNIRMNIPWEDALKDHLSIKYKRLERQIVDEVIELFSNDNNHHVIARVLGFR